MTTEIAVLNKLGVALATDSAVTITGAGKQKVFDTGDKLFELCTSGHDAVGIMINGNMDFLGVPWEVIIKSFREEQRSETARSMKDWLQCLLDFVGNHKTMSAAQELDFVDYVVSDETSEIRAGIFLSLSDMSETPVFSDLAKNVIEKRKEFYQAPKAESLKDVSVVDLTVMHGDRIKKAVSSQLGAFELTTEQLDDIASFCIEALLSSIQSGISTGIIVAGYGGGDMFPSVAMADVDGSVCGKIKYSHGDHLLVDRETNPAKVISFAQKDVVDRILSGADDKFVNESEKYLQSALTQAKDGVAAALQSAGLQADLAAGIMDDLIEGVVGRYKKEFVKDARQNFKNDFDDMVALMPKQDVIEFAEALVSITAIERNASSQQATVGGPVDIAFITKHEGFVWIKRKHYFDASLNPRYFWRKQKPHVNQGEQR